MATPTIPTTGAGRILGVQTAAETGTTHTFPSLSSLTKNAGDLLIAIVFLFDGNTANAEFSSWGGGFTEFGDFATTTTLSIGCAYKFSTGSETGTFTVTSSGSGRAALILMSIAGAHPSTPPEAGGYATGTNAAANPGALNPASWDIEDTLWIACAGTGEDATTGSFTAITAVPASYTNLFYQAAADDVVGSINAAVGFRGNAIASEDPGTFTNDTGAIRWGACTIGVRPVPTISDQPTSISPVTFTLTPIALTETVDDANRTLTEAIFTLTPVALTQSVGDVTTSISPVIFTLTPVTLTRYVPPDPSNLQVNVSVPAIASLTWDASPTAFVNRYSVFRRTPSTGLVFDPIVDVPAKVSVAALSYNDPSLAAAIYDWQVFGIVDTPSTIAGLYAWYDASNAASITQSAGFVSQWNDISGNGRHLTQGTGSLQPKTGTRTQNGLNVLDFASDYLARNPFALTQPFTAIGVFLTDSVVTSNRRVWDNTQAHESNAAGFDIRPANMNGDFGALVSPSPALTFTASVAYIVAFLPNGASSVMWRNGTTPTNTFNPGTNAQQSINLGASRANGDFWDGWMAEMIFFTGNKTANIPELMTYLNNKWGVY